MGFLSPYRVLDLTNERGLLAGKMFADLGADVLADPQLQFRGHFIELEHPIHGKTVVEGSRYQLSHTPAVVKRTGPTFGQDKATILRDILHYDEERIAALEAAGIFQ